MKVLSMDRVWSELEKKDGATCALLRNKGALLAALRGVAQDRSAGALAAPLETHVNALSVAAAERAEESAFAVGALGLVCCAASFAVPVLVAAECARFVASGGCVPLARGDAGVGDGAQAFLVLVGTQFFAQSPRGRLRQLFRLSFAFAEPDLLQLLASCAPVDRVAQREGEETAGALLYAEIKQSLAFQLGRYVNSKLNLLDFSDATSSQTGKG